jgi:transcriptional regulatory protein LevR
MQESLRQLEEDFFIFPDRKAAYKTAGDDSYTDIVRAYGQMQKEGTPVDEIREVIGRRVEDYIRKVSQQIAWKYANRSSMLKMIDRGVLDFTLKAVEKLSHALSRTFDQRLVQVLAFHIHSLIMQSKAGVRDSVSEIGDFRKHYPQEYAQAEILVEEIRSFFSVSVGDHEKDFFAIILANETLERTSKEMVRILVLSHGSGTASSIATAVNRLLDTSHVKSVDIPLECDVEDAYRQTLALVKASPNRQGVLLLVDMGSLLYFGQRITDETGIPTRTIDRVSTPFVLEATRRVLYKDETLDAVYTAVRKYIEWSVLQENSPVLPKAILVTCCTGIGTSAILKNRVQMILRERNIHSISVLTASYLAIVGQKTSYRDIRQKYDVVACVGNMAPGIDVTYFDMEHIIAEPSAEFLAFLDTCSGSFVPQQEWLSVYDDVEKILVDTTLCLNARQATWNIRRFLERLDMNPSSTSRIVLIKFSLHVAYMLERLIARQFIVFEDKEIYIRENQDIYDRIRGKIQELEEIYALQVTPDEICFIAEILKNKGKMEE